MHIVTIINSKWLKLLSSSPEVNVLLVNFIYCPCQFDSSTNTDLTMQSLLIQSDLQESSKQWSGTDDYLLSSQKATDYFYINLLSLIIT